ncbi:MAG: heparinase II/III family protein [Minwuia sp.]|uniref:heparinase II/III domain-containing protein n=1 Tax=Minwuia sp. TaxID=2493630 RepID=UPI003A8880BB
MMQTGNWIPAICAAVLLSAWPAAAQDVRELAQMRVNKPDIQDGLSPESDREMRPYPNDGAHPIENPPSFRWRQGKSGDVYEVQVRLQDGTDIVRFSSANLLTLRDALPAGTHSWRLRRWPAFSGPLNWTKRREFTVTELAEEREVFNPADAFREAAEAKRPRLLPREPDRSLLIADAYIGWKRQFFDQVAKRVAGQPLRLPPSEANLGPGGAEALSREELVRFRRQIRRSVNKVMRETYDGLIVWTVTRHLGEGQEALERAIAAAGWLAELDPYGGTSDAVADLLNMRIAKALAVAYDVAHDEMPPRLRQQIVQAIEIRVQAAFDTYVLDENRALTAYPMNSHGYRHAIGVLSIATLLAGDLPRARTWFDALYPVFIGLGNPWGGDDGGYANGVNYATWEILNNLQHWDTIRSAAGIDYFGSGWGRYVAQFLAYVIPPGSPNSGFGDGGEDHNPLVWTETARMLFERTGQPVAGMLYARWRDFIDESDINLTELEAEFAGWTFLLGAGNPPAALAGITAEEVGLPDSAVFPSIGWAAMHSDLDDPDRYSILFKSSPYGSFSHSHADQNSFIINGRQQPLAIDSGYYDTHKSRHHQAWTTQTMAHNAITFDGGKGQPWDDLKATGRLTRFTSCPGWEAVAGDASGAYRKHLTSAKRSLLYLRPDQVLVYDHLLSNEPRSFEWNIHAKRKMTETADGAVRIGMDDASLCIRQIAGPEMSFAQTDVFPVEPNKRLQPDWRPQWHGRFTASEPDWRMESLFLISLDCAPADVGPVTPIRGGGFKTVIDGYNVAISASSEAAIPADGSFRPAACRTPVDPALFGQATASGSDDTSATQAANRLRIGR